MYNSAQLSVIIHKMAEEITTQQLSDPILIGIHTGGVWLAERLQEHLKLAYPIGTLDISFYRDDFSQVGLNPEVKASNLPLAVDNRNIILVDDVLHSGRTIRAGLNEIFSYGRPSRVFLAVLIERPGRELPIQADVIGQSLDLADNEEAKLSNTDGELELNVIAIAPARFDSSPGRAGTGHTGADQ